VVEKISMNKLASRISLSLFLPMVRKHSPRI
jgi:hypothetical protein